MARAFTLLLLCLVLAAAGCAGGRAKYAEAPAPQFEVIPSLDGQEFAEKGEWVKAETRSAEYLHSTEPGRARFEVKDANRCMKWYKHFASPVDFKAYPFVEFEYRARRLQNDGVEYVLWLFDERPFHAAGFEVVTPHEIVCDWRPHTIRVPLARFNPTGPLTGAAIRVTSGKGGRAELEVLRIDFIGPEKAAQASAAAEAAECITVSQRRPFLVNSDIRTALVCPRVEGQTPIKAARVRFYESRGRLHCALHVEAESTATAAFKIRLRLFAGADPIASDEASFRVRKTDTYLPQLADGDLDFDLGPAKDLARATDFEIEVENVTALQ